MKSSFNGLQLSDEGVYHAYDLSPEELEKLKRHFGNRVSWSKGIWTFFEIYQRKIILKLFVHEAHLLIEFDVGRDLSKLFKSNDISKSDIEKLSNKLFDKKVNIEVSYNWKDNSWSISNYDHFLKLLESLIAEF